MRDKRPKKPAYIGIDIGGTKTLYALFDESFEVVAEEKLRTHSGKGGERAFTRSLKRSLKSMVAEAAERGLKVRCVGVGCAGDIDLKRGIVRHSPNLPFLDGYAMQERIEKVVEAPVFVGNDVQVGLYGEFRRGAAKEARHVMGVWIGTGVGGALIIDRRLHLGANGAAGNIGNYLLNTVDVAHEAPRKERLDHVASRYAIAGVAASMAAKHGAPKLRKVTGTDVTDIRAENLAEAIRKGEKAIEKLVRSRARVLGAAIANFVDFINVDLVVLGGGLVEAMPRLIAKEVEKSIHAHASPRAARAVRIAPAKLGRHSITLGAACLALDMRGETPPIDTRSI